MKFPFLKTLCLVGLVFTMGCAGKEAKPEDSVDSESTSNKKTCEYSDTGKWVCSGAGPAVRGSKPAGKDKNVDPVEDMH